MDLKDVSDDFIMGLDIDKKQFQLLAMACTEMGWKLASVGSGWVELEVKSSKGNKNYFHFNRYEFIKSQYVLGDY